MPRKPADPRARLHDWRERQLDRHDPVAFAVLEALQRRAQQYAGEPRRVLEQRLAERVQAYAGRLPRGAGRAAAPVAPPAPPLTALVAELTVRAQAPAAMDAPAGNAPTAGYPALPAVQEFRALWSNVRSRSQVRQSLAAAPSDGGPLNSAVLVQRAITRMGEISPGYLTHFLAYLDNLSWLEQLQPRNATAASAAGRSAKPRRPRAAKP